MRLRKIIAAFGVVAALSAGGAAVPAVAASASTCTLYHDGNCITAASASTCTYYHNGACTGA